MSLNAQHINIKHYRSPASEMPSKSSDVRRATFMTTSAGFAHTCRASYTHLDASFGERGKRDRGTEREGGSLTPQRLQV